MTAAGYYTSTKRFTSTCKTSIISVIFFDTICLAALKVYAISNKIFV